jgi:hypothetical protein
VTEIYRHRNECRTHHHTAPQYKKSREKTNPTL